MAKKRNNSTVQPLAHYWMPPEDATESGVGHPWACAATTYELDAGFLEAELLPRFLGLKFDHTENEPSFLVEREEALSLARVAVLVDQSRFDSRQTTMRWDQIPVQIPGGILHAKITLLAWEHFVRVIVGSANLTRSGYRRNREMFASLDFWNGLDSAPLNVLRDTLDFLDLILSWACVAPEVRNRTSETFARIWQTARSWNAAPEDFTPREKPRVTLAVTHPANEGLAARSTLAEVVKLWGNRRAQDVSVVTPFVGEHKPGDSHDAVIDKLVEVPCTRECSAWLVVPELPKTSGEEKARVPISQIVGEAWSAAFKPPRAAYVLPLPQCVEDKEDRNRTLHSKVLLLESEEDVLMMVGSSNFTPHGMGIGAHNVEANLVFEDRYSEKRGGLHLDERLQLPLDWNKALEVTDVVWEEPKEPSEDTPDASKMLPPFFAWASYSQITGELKLAFDRSKTEPSLWAVRLPGATEESALELFARARLPEGSAEATLSYFFSEDARGVNIVALVVQWSESDEQTRQARLGVCVESPESLLPPSEYLKLSANAIIECLISGKSPSQWYDQEQNTVGGGSKNDAAIESLRAVDTAGYLLYRVRRFGRALRGMCDRISRTLPQPNAIRYRLLNDPFGPLSLAKTIVAREDGDNNSWCAQLDVEHRVFLLAEILLAISYLKQQFHRASRGKERKQLMTRFDETEKQLSELLENEVLHYGGGLPVNLKAYIEAVRGRIGEQCIRSAAEVEDAGQLAVRT